MSFGFRKKKKNFSFEKANIEDFKIPLKEIKLGTENFSAENCIGGGGFGKVYKGKLSDSRWLGTVAVKQLNPDSLQGNIEFRNEVSMLHNYKHKNIVTFVGYCDEGKEMIIVYEYAVNGSLDKHLRDEDMMQSMTWEKRLRICIGAAEGLNYLHSGLGDHLRVIHRDVKSSNILLDENLEAKISDFGLSKFCPKNQPHTHINTRVAGTCGYLDPHYHLTSILTKESDVYSFGVILFEMLSGRLVFPKKQCREGADADDSHDLVTLVKRYEGRLDHILDDNLKGRIQPKSFDTFKEIAFQCLSVEYTNRPKMETVVEKLKEALNFQLNIESPSPTTKSKRTIGSRTFDVFLSRVTDVKKINFADHLHYALDRQEIDIFNVNKLIERGHSYAASVTRAIERSYIAIIIFSEGYAASPSCLDGLVAIMNCPGLINRIVLTVFCDVTPSEVRRQTGRFGNAFYKHASTSDKKIVEGWRKALVKATGLPGWVLNNDATKRDEAQLIRNIVDFLSDKLRDLKPKVVRETRSGDRVSNTSNHHSLFEITEIVEEEEEEPFSVVWPAAP